MKAEKKNKCEMRIIVSCHGEGVTHVSGLKKGDPEFYCCMGCRAYLSRQGVKLKYASPKTPKTPKERS